MHYEAKKVLRVKEYRVINYSNNCSNGIFNKPITEATLFCALTEVIDDLHLMIERYRLNELIS